MNIYALCDQSTLSAKGLSLKEFVALCKKNSVEIIQYRAKSDDLLYIKSQLISLRQLWDKFLIINDHYALASFCDGVHLGQDDIVAIDSDKTNAINILRSVIGKDKIVGLSTHNEYEILEANDLDLNYIGLGAYRPTSTKDVDNILGDELDPLASISKHKVAAIGGVKLSDTFKYVHYSVIGSGLYED